MLMPINITNIYKANGVRTVQYTANISINHQILPDQLATILQAFLAFAILLHRQYLSLLELII